MAEHRTIGDVVEPGGARVVLLARIWDGKVMLDHPELRNHHDAVLQTVSEPHHVEHDPRPGRKRYYRRGAGPSRWLMVVVSFEQQPARIITALALRKGPREWKP